MDRQPSEGLRLLRDVADALLRGIRKMVGRLAEDLGLARIEGDEAEQRADQGRLAGAIAAHEPHDRAGGHVERDVPEHGRAVGLAHRDALQWAGG